MKIIKTKRYANTFEGYDPFKVDFTYERKKAEQMDTDSLFHALKDAIEASQVSINEGKYYDQVSVYRIELTSRGISIFEQDKKLKEIKSLHFNSLEDDMKSAKEGELYTPSDEDSWVNEGKGYKYHRQRKRNRDESPESKWDSVLKDMQDVESPIFAQNKKIIKTKNYKNIINKIIHRNNNYGNV